MKPKFILFMLVAVLAAALLSGCASRAAFSNSWPGLASDGEVAYLASGQYFHAVSLTDSKEIWRYPAKASGSLQFIAQPVVAPDGTIIIGSAGSDHRLVALDPSSLSSGETFKTPAEKWTFAEAKGSWIAGVLVLNDKVFAPNSDGFFVHIGHPGWIIYQIGLEKDRTWWCPLGTTDYRWIPGICLLGGSLSVRH